MNLCQCGCGREAARHASFVRGHNRRRALADRFWEKVDKSNPDGCWPWTGAKNGDGYGLVLVGRGAKLAHRIACDLDGRPLAATETGRHTCDNPPCCRPDHIIPGTQAENNGDAAARGRARNRHGRVTEQQKAEIRRLAAEGGRTQDEIGALVGVTQASVGRALHGRKRPGT